MINFSKIPSGYYDIDNNVYYDENYHHHRLDGLAVPKCFVNTGYYIHGKQYTEKEFIKITAFNKDTDLDIAAL